MSDRLQRDYLLRLPLPIAQLYLRAHNAKDPRARHDHGFFVLEAAAKLSAVAMLAQALDAQLREPHDDWTQRLGALARPSLGHWAQLVRWLASSDQVEGDLPRALQRRLDASATPALLELYRRMSTGPDERPSTSVRFRLLDLIDALVSYRNAVMGHGGPRAAEFYESRMGPLWFPALNEALSPGIWPCLGQEENRLVHLGDLRVVEPGVVEASARELTGLQGERRDPARLPQALLDRWFHRGAGPPAVALRNPEGELIPVGPMLRFRESELADEVLIHNACKGKADLEQLSYATGRLHKELGAAPALHQYLGLADAPEPAHDATPAAAAQSDSAFDGAPPLDDSDQPTAAAPATPTPSAPATPTATLGPGAELADYRVVAELGKGGMGVVFLAEQKTLGRLVALKTLPEAQAHHPEVLARFSREVQVLGRCDHPHIAKLLDHGETQGVRYYTMEYVPGADLEQVWRQLAKQDQRREPADLDAALAEACRRNRRKLEQGLSGTKASADTTPDPSQGSADASAILRDALTTLTPDREHDPDPTLAEAPEPYHRRICRMMADACEALDLLHERGVVHRDVSPANLMLNPDGRRLVVMDFGLARPGAGQADVTAPGGFVGKYRYAAPEQLAGQEIGPPADVRGLGVTLWELLTRRRLFAQGEDARAITALVHERDVPALRAVVPDADRDLEAIVAQAVHRDPNQRTANAGELARHLRLYLEGRALPIRQPGLGELALRWAREHQPLVTGAAAVGVVAASILTWSFWKLEDKNQALQQTNQQLVASRDQAQTNATTARQLATTLFTRVNDSPLFQAALLTADHRNLLRDLIADYQTLLADRLGEDADNAEQAARIRLALAAAQTQADDFTGAQDTLERAAQTIERVADPAIRRDLALDRRLLAMERRLAAGQADTDPQAIARFAQNLYAGSAANPPLPRPETLLGNIAPTNPDDTGPTHPDWRRTAQTERLLARLYRTVAQDDDELRHRHHALLLFQIRHEALTRQPAEDGPTPAQRAALAEARYDWRRAALELSRSYQAVGQPQLAHATAVEVEPRDLQALSPAQLARLGPLDQLIVAEAWSQRADTQPPAPQEDPDSPDASPDNRLALAAAAYRTALSLTDQAPDDARPRLVALRSAATLASLSANRLREAGAFDADDPAETLDAFPPPPVPSSARVELQQLALQARAKVAVRQGAAAEARLQAGDPAPAPDLADARAQLAHATGALLVLTAEAQTLAAAHPERLSTLQDEADIARSAAYSLYLLQAYNPEAAEALALQHAGEYSATPVVDAYQRCLDLIDELRNRRDARDLAPNPRVAMLEARARYDYALVLEPLRARASQRQGERNQALARALANEQTGQLQRAADTLVPFQEPFDYIQVDGLFEQRARIDSARGIFLTRNGDPVEGLMAMVEAERGLAQIRAYSNPAYAQALAQQLDQLGYSDLVVSLAKLAPSLTDSQRQALTAPLSALERFAELRERPGGVQDLRDALTAPPQ